MADQATPSEPAERPAAPVPSPAAPAAGGRGRVYLALVLLLWLLASALCATSAVARSRRLGYANPDDAMLVQYVWNTTQGRPMRYTLESFAPPWERSHLAVHASFLSFLHAPLLALSGTHEALLVVQPVLALAGAIPLFVLAARRLGPAPAAALSACLLAYPLLLANSIRLGAYYTFTPALLLLALERWDADARRTAALAFCAAFLDREEVSLPVLVFLALEAARASGPRRRWALGIAGVGLGWTLLYLGLLKAHLFGAPPGDFLFRYTHLGGSIPAVLASPLLRPGAFFGALVAPSALILLVLLLFPLAFLPLASPRHLLAAGVPFLVVALSNQESDRHLGRFLVPAIPFLFAGAAAGLAWLRERRPALRLDRVGLVAAGLATLLAWQADWGFLARYEAVRALSPRHVQLLERWTPEHAELRAALAAIPPEASVSVSPTAMLFVAQRREAHPFPVRAEEVDFVIVDTHPQMPRWPDRGLAAHRAAIEATLKRAERVVRIGRFVIADQR